MFYIYEEGADIFFIFLEVPCHYCHLIRLDHPVLSYTCIKALGFRS